MTRNRYTARAERVGAWWAIEVEGVRNAVSQARRLDQVEAMAREVVALLLDVAEDSFDLDIEVSMPAQWAEWVASVKAAQATAAVTEAEAGRKAREVARALRAAGLPIRDVGAVLGVSHQRVSQLVNT